MELIYGDCLEKLKTIPDESVDHIITDPPYGVSKKNNFHTMGRSGIDFGEWDKDFDQTAWLDEAYRVLKKGGSLIIFNGWRNLGHIANSGESIGFITKDIIRWIKQNPMPRNRDRRYIVDFEFAIWMVKDGKWVFNRLNDTYDRPEYNYPTVAGKEKTIHTTQKPVALMEEMIRRHTNEGQIVLDPFMGSGTTGEACINTGRDFIGIELNEEYFNVAKNRIEGRSKECQ